MSGSQHRFVSKAQWRWAFATHQRFARRWAEAIKASVVRGYRALALRKHPPGAGRTARAFLKPGR